MFEYIKKSAVLSNGVEMYKIASLDRRDLLYWIKKIEWVWYEIYFLLKEFSWDWKLYIMEHKKWSMRYPTMCYLERDWFVTISSKTPEKYIKIMREIWFWICDSLDMDHVHHF